MSLRDMKPSAPRIGAGRGKFRLAAAALLAPALLLGGCVWQPLYGTNQYAPGSVSGGYALQLVDVAEIDSRVGQQIRNHLVFLLQGGKDNRDVPYLVKLRVTETTEQLAAIKNVRDFTAGTVTVTVSYDLFEKATMRRVASGRRVASAPYDRTSQNYANRRAERDAENRAAREAAEQLRMALAADLAG